MNIEEVRKLIVQNQNEITHLNDERRQLEESRNTMSEEEYNRELENINAHLTEEQESLKQNEELNHNYSIMVENLRRLNSLSKISPRDDNDIAEIQEEKNRRLATIERVASLLPEDLLSEAKNEIPKQNRQEQPIKTTQTENQSMESQPVEESHITKKQELEDTIARQQQEVLHLNNILNQLRSVRRSLSEEEYIQERKNITEYIERENNRLDDNRKLVKAYENMLSNIRKLNELDNITPRDSQDEIQIQEEKEQREEEIKRAKSLLPEEYQEEISNIIQQELADKKEQTQASNQQLTTKNQKTATEQILDPNFKPHLIPWDEYKKIFRQAQKESQNNEENLKIINNIHDKYKKDRIVFQKDENGNVVCYDNTTLPRPREREVGENPKDYEKFLVDEYGPRIEDYYEKKDTKGLEEQEPLSLIEEKIGKQLPAVVEEKIGKQLPAVVEQEKEKPISESKPKAEKKTLQQIMYELQKDLEIKAKSGKRYQASNIKVGKNFKNELKTGNVWYNVVHFAPTLIKTAVSGIAKAYSKFQLWRTQQTHTMEVLKERINNLSDQDLSVIWKEYRGTQVNQDSFTSALNNMLNERVQQFTKKRVEEINTKISAGYNQIFADYKVIQKINRALGQEELSAEEKERLNAQKQALLAGKAEEIGKVRHLYILGNNYYSGGAHGFSEDMKAAGTNLSKVGKRFAVNHDYDNELQAKKAKLEMLEQKAIRSNDNERALEAFIQYERLKNDETMFGRGLRGFGTQRSEGKMYYSPLVGELDYRDDPFIRDVFTTVAMVGAAVSAANAIHTHVTEANKVLDAEAAKAAQVNSANEATMEQVQQTGQNIAGYRTTFEKGMEAQANSDAINILNVGERSASDQSVNAGGGWTTGSVYVEADKIAHETAKQAYETSQQQIHDIASKYTQGLLTESEVTHAFADMATQSQQTLNSVIENALPHFQTYMQNHPHFELAEVGQAMDFLVKNPDAIPQMFQGMVNVVDMGENLAGLTISQVEALQSLPSDLQTTLLGAVSSAALAYNCAKSTSKNRSNGRTEQEQQIIDMVQEYQTEQTNQTEKAGHKAV